MVAAVSNGIAKQADERRKKASLEGLAFQFGFGSRACRFAMNSLRSVCVPDFQWKQELARIHCVALYAGVILVRSYATFGVWP